MLAHWDADMSAQRPEPLIATAWIDRLRPRRAVLTHMDQSLDYRELAAELPSGVEPGYDGLAIELPDP